MNLVNNRIKLHRLTAKKLKFWLQITSRSSREESRSSRVWQFSLQNFNLLASHYY